MNEDRHQRLRIARARNDSICLRMLFAFSVLTLVLGVLESVRDPATGPVRFAEISLAVATALSFLVVVFTAGLSLVVLNPDAYSSERDRALPSWGRYARLANRVAVRVVLFSWLPLPLALMVLDVIGHYALGWPEDGAYARWHEEVQFVAAAALVVALLVAVVWLTAELIAGFREPRRPMSSGQTNRQTH